MKLSKFITKYGGQLAATIEENLTPIYNPMKPSGVDEFEWLMHKLLRTPFPVQGEVIKAISKALYKDGRKHLFAVGEMGTGKTMIGLSVINNAPNPIRSVVVCPTHLVEKWKRETRQTIPNVKVVDLSVPNVISILDMLREERTTRPTTHEVYVISKEKAKLSYGWKPVASKKVKSSRPHCPDCGSKLMDGDEILTWDDLEKKRHFCSECGAALWQADNKLRRFSPANFIRQYLKGYWDMSIIDEIQDFKAGDSLQGYAMGDLLAAAKMCLCLTGTLNGGYADDLFFLLFRMDPAKLKADGFGYGNTTEWLQTYGTLERVKKLEDEDNYYGRGKKKGEMKRKRPGVSPLVIGKYLLDKAVFIRLADVIEGLPPYEENVITIKMDTEQKAQYDELADSLKSAIKTHGTRALGAMLQSLLSYPDSCVVFPEHIEIKDKTKEVVEVIEAPAIKLKKGQLLPKEEDFVNLCKAEKAEGRKVLCYLTFTESRDIRPRLQQILEDAKLRVQVLHASVPPKKREAWVAKHAPDCDVLMCNAELVKTGLDLIEFQTIIFFQVGYNIYTLRQAARRSWRIGQTRPVKVFFFCYGDTMQEIAIALIAKKLEVALMVEGDLPEGLAEYASSGESLIEEMGKALVEGGDYSGAEKAWANFRKMEIESQLGITGKETIFSEASRKVAKKPESIKSSKTTIDQNVVVKVIVLEGKKKKQSIVEVKYGDIDSVLNGKPAQFAMF